jgi:hypothetical protein
MISSIYLDMTLCDLLKDNWHFKGTCHLCRWTMKMEVTCSSVTSVDFQWTPQCYITEDRTFHNHHCANLRYFKMFSMFPFSTWPAHLIPLHLASLTIMCQKIHILKFFIMYASVPLFLYLSYIQIFSLSLNLCFCLDEKAVCWNSNSTLLCQL